MRTVLRTISSAIICSRLCYLLIVQTQRLVLFGMLSPVSDTHYLNTILRTPTVMLIVTVHLFGQTCVFFERQHHHCPRVLYPL